MSEYLRCSVLGAGMLPTIDNCAELVKEGARIVPTGIRVLSSLSHLSLFCKHSYSKLLHIPLLTKGTNAGPCPAG